MTAKQATRGDIGKLSNEEIALGIDYRGDENVLIDALIGTGWLDPHPDFRLLIHDWFDHADDAIHMRLARAKLTFATGEVPKLYRLPSWERKEASEFFDVGTESQSVRTENGKRAHGVHTDRQSVREPRQSPAPPEPRQSPKVEEKPTPPNPPAQQPSAPDGAGGSVPEPPFELAAGKPPARRRARHQSLNPEQRLWFDQWWPNYWRRVARKDAEAAFRNVVLTQARFDLVMAATRAQTKSMLQRPPDKRPHPATWLNGERWADEPSAPQIPVNGHVSSAMKPGPRLVPTQQQLIEANRWIAEHDEDPSAREQAALWLKQNLKQA